MLALLDRYLEHLEEDRNLSSHTLRAYRHDLDRFLIFLADDFLTREADQIRPAEIDSASRAEPYSVALIAENVASTAEIATSVKPS